MSVDRVTVSLPGEVRRAAQRIAQDLDVPFSSVVSEALESWMRGRLVDAWVSEYQAEFGVFDEAELQRIAAEAGVPYAPPARRRLGRRGSCCARREPPTSSTRS